MEHIASLIKPIQTIKSHHIFIIIGALARMAGAVLAILQMIIQADL
jgi:hypothetical protein